MYEFSKEQILEWCKKYDEEEDQWSPELEQRLGEKFRNNKEVTKDDLAEVMNWKFITMPGRLKRQLNLVESSDDNQIRKLSKLAFESDDEIQRIKYLLGIKSVGNAVASTILAFYDPKNYCVFDIHIYDEIFGTTPKTRPKTMSNNPKLYLNLLEELRRIAYKHNIDVRLVEKALFKKKYDESKDRRN